MIGSLVGGIIFFLWSFLAWTVLPMHLHTVMYTPAQDSILKVLAESGMESGVYSMPMVDNRNVHSMMDEKYREECQKMMEANKGKPMATVTYLKEGMKFDGSTLFLGFLYEFIAVLAVCILLAPAFASTSSFFGRWWLVLLVGLVITMSGPMISHNFMGTPWDFTLDMIVDTFANWGIVGLWLAWYFRK